MARLSNKDICSWTGFNILTHSETCVQEDNIGYLPTINAPATQLSTVNEILLQSLNIMKSRSWNHLEITWKNQELFKDIILRMGVFHTTCAFMATIGQRFSDAGLRDLCVEAGVIGDGSVSGVTAHFHRGRERRVKAAPRSPLLIAATLVNESISTGAPRNVSQPQRYLSIVFYFWREPLLNRVNFNRADRPGRKWNSKSHRASGQFSK